MPPSRHGGVRRLIRRWDARQCWSVQSIKRKFWTRSTQREPARSNIHTSATRFRSSALIERGVGCRVQRKAAPFALGAGSAGYEADQPRFDGLARRRTVRQDALRFLDEPAVVAVEHFQIKRGLVAEGGIQAGFAKTALEALAPEYVESDIQNLVGIEGARSCHAPT